MYIFANLTFQSCCTKTNSCFYAIIEVRAEEKEQTKFMARRQKAGQYHDLKAVNKFSEAWKISNMLARL